MSNTSAAHRLHSGVAVPADPLNNNEAEQCKKLRSDWMNQSTNVTDEQLAQLETYYARKFPRAPPKPGMFVTAKQESAQSGHKVAPNMTAAFQDWYREQLLHRPAGQRGSSGCRIAPNDTKEFQDWYREATLLAPARTATEQQQHDQMEAMLMPFLAEWRERRGGRL